MNTPKLLINGDKITLESFSNISPNQKICIKIFNYRKIVISLSLPKDDFLLDCHTIITLNNSTYQNQQLVDKLLAAGLNSCSHFINCDDFYIATFID